MRRKSAILLLTFLTVANCYGQTVNTLKRSPSIYSNWMSIAYLNCLKTNLPCQCEKSREYFLISLDTTKKFALLYDGRTNYDYNLFDFKTISPNNLEVYNKQYSETLFKDTITVIGHIKIKNDTLHFIGSAEKEINFILYNTGDNDSYFIEHVKLLNSAMTVRGYDNLNKTLRSDSLKCFCNWELGGINLVIGKQREWILEKKDNELCIYEWTNPPSAKQIDLKIEKKLLKKLKW
jgi:hypothetical protein